MKRFNNGRTKVRVHAMRVAIAGRHPFSVPPVYDPYFPPSQPAVATPTTTTVHDHGPRLVGFSCTLRDDGNVAAFPKSISNSGFRKEI